MVASHWLTEKDLNIRSTASLGSGAGGWATLSMAASCPTRSEHKKGKEQSRAKKRKGAKQSTGKERSKAEQRKGKEQSRG